MGKSLSDDLRVRVVEAVEAGTSRRQASARFGVSVSSAIRWVRRWRDQGEVRARPQGGDRRSGRIDAVEQRAVDVDAKAPFLGRADRSDGALEGARLIDGVVVMVFQAVQMDRKRQVRRRRELIELFFKQKRIGAKIDELLAPDDAFDNFHDILVYQRFPPGDGDHRGAAFINRVHAFLGAEPPIEDIVFIVDLTAADTRQIAAE